MSEVGANGPLGKFVWYEYMGDDLEGAAAFYAKVVGWSIAEGDMTDFPYKIASAGGAQVAGLMKIPPEAKAMGRPAVLDRLRLGSRRRRRVAQARRRRGRREAASNRHPRRRPLRRRR